MVPVCVASKMKTMPLLSRSLFSGGCRRLFEHKRSHTLHHTTNTPSYLLFLSSHEKSGEGERAERASRVNGLRCALHIP